MPNILPVRAKPVCTSSAISRMPCSSQILRSASSSSVGAGWKPPSPCTGSMMMAATLHRIDVGAEQIVDRLQRVGDVTPCCGTGNGTCQMPAGIGPNFFL